MLRFACLALLCFAALPASAGQLTIFAAASTKTALDDIAALWHDRPAIAWLPPTLAAPRWPAKSNAGLRRM